MDILSSVSFSISVLGIIVITWGVLLVIYNVLRYEVFRLLKIHREKLEKTVDTHYLRQELGAYILLGLEFMIAGDIIHTVVRPNKESLILLGSIVAIRTVISFFLNKELADYK